jgi:hypothetical protein
VHSTRQCTPERLRQRWPTMTDRGAQCDDASSARLPKSLLISGVGTFVGSAMLSVRLIWEQTVWTWERGPQMVGFSLAHIHPGFFIAGILCSFALILWVVVVAFLTVRSLVKRRHIPSMRWVGLGLAAALVVASGLPSSFWQRVFIGRMASSPYSGDLFMRAAYAREVGLVRAYVSHGVPIDMVDHSTWETATHAAAASGSLPTLRYLISKGADVNALDRYGDSPLELASSNGHEAAARFLAEHGARRIRGDEAQRQKAMGDEVREEMEKANPGSTTWHR